MAPLIEQAIHKIAHRYRRGGLATTLYERPRPGAAEVLAPAEKQRIVAMALQCATAGGGALDGAPDRPGGGEAPVGSARGPRDDSRAPAIPRLETVAGEE
jgi:hypothetical protein